MDYESLKIASHFDFFLKVIAQTLPVLHWTEEFYNKNAKNRLKNKNAKNIFIMISAVCETWQELYGRR